VVFVAEFGIGDKAVFLVKSQNAFVVFYICVNVEKTGGYRIIVFLRSEERTLWSLKSMNP
jgi:hypothetical protein